MNKKVIKYILLPCFLLISSIASAQVEEADGKNVSILKQFNFRDDIVYKTIDGQSLEMIVFKPTNKRFAKTPVMLFTHGGGWSGGDRYVILKKNFVDPLKSLLDSGIACVSIEYRLTKGSSTVVDAVADCKDAGKYLVKNADDLGLDINKMGVWGGSAGGHLSLMTALADDSKFQSDPVFKGISPSYRCVVAYYPQTTFTDKKILDDTKYFPTPKLEKMFGVGFQCGSEMANLVSPVNHIKKNQPPVLILHGTADSILSYHNATHFVDRAKQLGAKVELLTVTNGGHGFGGKNVSPSPAIISKTASDFAIEHLLY